MSKTLKISRKTESVKLHFDRVKQIVVIKKIESAENLRVLEMKGMFINLKRVNLDGEDCGMEKIWDFSKANEKDLSEISLRLDMSGVKSAEISIDFPKKGDELSEAIIIQYELFDRLPVNVPDAGFTDHLKDARNHKILFSGKFGQGKSTFLDYYFIEREDQYNVFRLFPVNYSVASNEDIFRYIKCELIFQLLSKDIDFNKAETSHPNALKTFAKKNLDKAIAPLLLLAPKVGRNMFQMFEKYKELSLEYQEYHEQLNIDDSLLAQGYVKTFYENEGGLFEDDFFTHLIRSQIERLRDNSGHKGNILVIDDLDRMDPEHIFRILNVFSAHFDRLHLGGESSYDKFGFDRIILVCDYENLRHIYEHKYGCKVDFKGYINKYYSTEKFNFENKKVVKNILGNIDNHPKEFNMLSSPDYLFLYHISNALFNADLISLRDILNLKSIGLKSVFSQRDKFRGAETHWLSISEFVSPILLLSKIGSAETLKNNLKDLKEGNFDLKMNWTEYSILAIVCLYSNSSKSIMVPYKGIEGQRLEVSFDCKSSFDRSDFLHLTAYDVHYNRSLPTLVPEYSFTEFIDLLCLVVDKIEQLKISS